MHLYKDVMYLYKDVMHLYKDVIHLYNFYRSLLFWYFDFCFTSDRQSTKRHETFEGKQVSIECFEIEIWKVLHFY